MPFDRSTTCVAILCRITAFKLQSLELMIYSENGLVFLSVFLVETWYFQLKQIRLMNGMGLHPRNLLIFNIPLPSPKTWDSVGEAPGVYCHHTELYWRWLRTYRTRKLQKRKPVHQSQRWQTAPTVPEWQYARLIARFQHAVRNKPVKAFFLSNICEIHDLIIW